jgi:hypothetical protein
MTREQELQAMLNTAIEYLEFISMQGCCETCTICCPCEAESALRKIIPNHKLFKGNENE